MNHQVSKHQHQQLFLITLILYLYLTTTTTALPSIVTLTTPQNSCNIYLSTKHTSKSSQLISPSGHAAKTVVLDGKDGALHFVSCTGEDSKAIDKYFVSAISEIKACEVVEDDRHYSLDLYDTDGTSGTAGNVGEGEGRSVRHYDSGVCTLDHNKLVAVLSSNLKFLNFNAGLSNQGVIPINVQCVTVYNKSSSSNSSHKKSLPHSFVVKNSSNNINNSKVGRKPSLSSLDSFGYVSDYTECGYMFSGVSPPVYLQKMKDEINSYDNNHKKLDRKLQAEGLSFFRASIERGVSSGGKDIILYILDGSEEGGVRLVRKNFVGRLD